MKPTLTRRFRRRNTSSRSEGTFFKKQGQQEQNFFGEPSHDSFFQPAVASAQTIQRKCADCENEDKQVHRMSEKKEEEKVQRLAEEKDKDKVQKKDAAGSSTGAANISSYVNSLNGKGNPLPAKTNHFFSARIGYDFSDVKVHTDKEAADSANAVNAKAYTVGNNVVFNEGEYNDETSEGKKLMAHELAHVVQQRGLKDYRVLQKTEKKLIPRSLTKPYEKRTADAVREYFKRDPNIKYDIAEIVCEFAKGGIICKAKLTNGIVVTVFWQPKTNKVNVSACVDKDNYVCQYDYVTDSNGSTKLTQTFCDLLACGF